MTQGGEEILKIEGEVKEQTEQAGSAEHAHTLFAEPIFHLGSFQITNSLITSWFAVFIIVVISIVLRIKQSVVPSKIQHLFEILIEGALDMCDQVTNDRKLSMQIFPFAITVFFFILINNWLGIMPLGGFGVLEKGAHGVAFTSYLRGSTADINTTIALAVMAVIGANLFGVFSIGIWKTLNKYVNLKVLGSIFTKVKHDPTVVIVAPITFFVGLIEIVGEFAKVASLSFRLFGNVFAGEVLLASMAALASYFIPIPFLFLEILVGVVQAVIFATLLVVYFTISASDHDEHEEHAEHRESSHGEVGIKEVTV